MVSGGDSVVISSMRSSLGLNIPLLPYFFAYARIEDSGETAHNTI